MFWKTKCMFLLYALKIFFLLEFIFSYSNCFIHFSWYSPLETKAKKNELITDFSEHFYDYHLIVFYFREAFKSFNLKKNKIYVSVIIEAVHFYVVTTFINVFNSEIIFSPPVEYSLIKFTLKRNVPLFFLSWVPADS